MDIPFFFESGPITHLVGQSNEVSIMPDGWEVIMLIDLVAQVSSVNSGFCEQMALEIHPLDRVLEFTGTGRGAILYLAYVEVNLQVPGIREDNEDVLMLVIPTTTYAEKVLVMVGSKIINRAMNVIIKGEE